MNILVPEHLSKRLWYTGPRAALFKSMHIRTVTAFVVLGTEKSEDPPFNTSEDELRDHERVSSTDSKVETASTVISLLDVKEQSTSGGNDDPFDDKSDEKTSTDAESLADDETLKRADGNTNSEEKNVDSKKSQDDDNEKTDTIFLSNTETGTLLI